jgi:Mrp family chromosome partitioning ATPase
MKRWAGGALWMSARAKNALRRRARIAVVSGVAFVAALVTFVLIPRRATRVATAVEARIPDRPDSQPTLNARIAALATIASSDSLLALARREAAQALAQSIDTLPFYLIPRRDSLTTRVAVLSRLIERAQSTPLPSAYRTLGSSPEIRSAPIVQSLLDSLATIERERETFGALGGADPLAIALSARANSIGRSLVAIAVSRRNELRAALQPLLPPRAPPIAATPTADTMAVHVQRNEAIGILNAANARLVEIRRRNQEIDRMAAQARQIANVDAPPWAMLASALVIALALGFALSLLVEVRNPHIADVREAEQTAGTRVLTVVDPREQIVERARRQSDVEAPPLIDVISDTYRILYLHLSSLDAPVNAVTITGDDMDIASTVAVNVASIAAYEARSTLVIDGDPVTGGVAGALRIPPDPGLTAVLAEQVALSDAVVFTTIGRDQMLAVIPSGKRVGQPTANGVKKVKEDLERMSSRYDMIVFTAPLAQTKQDPTTVLPSADVILCARMARTPLRELSSAVETLRGAGMRVHGLVLWNTESPRLRTRDELLAAAKRPPREVDLESAAPATR